MIDVPQRFRPRIGIEYPPSNKVIFEEWFYSRYNIEDNKSDRVYLPVFPTAYQVNARYTRNRGAMLQIEQYCRKLDKRTKYFTICQYDDGIKFNLHGLDVKIYGMGGGHFDYPLPLICQPHPFIFNTGRTVFASFLGANNHPVRREVLALKSDDYQISSDKVEIKEYCELMAKSIFALCPRGYGISSFRICEALQMGSIPVYISDSFIMPFGLDFNEFGVVIKRGEDINKVLRSISLCDIKKKQEAGKRIYQEYYTYEGCYRNIMKSL